MNKDEAIKILNSVPAHMDKFESENKRFGFLFPCNICVHRHGAATDEPCSLCGHNIGCEQGDDGPADNQ